MTLRGGCHCNNIQITWHVIDFSLVPRACQCDYCRARGARYVSKSGSRFEVSIRDSKLHRTIQHGSNSARFHECTNCDQLVFVTALIEGEMYGVLNAHQLINKAGFGTPVEADYSDQSATQKMHRWRQNWCHPVVIKS